MSGSVLVVLALMAAVAGASLFVIFMCIAAPEVFTLRCW